MLTGEELENLSDEEFRQRVRAARVYARVSPQQKIRIVNALQQAGEFSAMTGDGVNDAPHSSRPISASPWDSKAARRGARSLRHGAVDDNFATIVTAVREGRRIFDNIRKFIKYTMTSNAGEI